MLLNLPGYDQAAAFTGEYEALPPGGYVCRIIRAPRVEHWKNGEGQSLLLPLDIVEGEQKGFFERQYAADARPEKKWGCIHRQSIPIKGKTTKFDEVLSFFKGMITAIENSNTGFKWNKDTDTLNGKLIGCIFGREEYFNITIGKNTFSTKVIFVRSADIIRKGEFKVPEDKMLIVKDLDNLGFTEVSGRTIKPIINEGDLPF